VSWLNVVLPIITLVAGAALTYAAESRREAQRRRDARIDALRTERATAYRQFMRDAHLAAHLAGRSAPGVPVPIGNAAEALARVDSDVARDLYELELFADDDVLAAAREVRNTLTVFRDSVMDGAEYMGERYREKLGSYQGARTMYLRVARQALTA
jgi:hypothetical protein